MTASERATSAQRPRAEKISDQVARLILSDIVARELPPGTMLPSEAQMTDEFGVGRATVREALRILEVHGLISVKQGPRGGPMVGAVRSSDFGRMSTFYFHAQRAQFGDLLRARLAIEPLMARMAAEGADDTVRGQLLLNLREAEMAINESGSTWGKLTTEFHGLISGATGNPVLDLIGSSLNDIHALRARPLFPKGQRGVVLTVHQKIADAICSGNGERAEYLARRHMEELIGGLNKLDPGLMAEVIDWK